MAITEINLHVFDAQRYAQARITLDEDELNFSYTPFHLSEA